MPQSYAELQEMIKTVKKNMDKQKEEIEFKLKHLQERTYFLIHAKEKGIADAILTERIKEWKAYKELNPVKIQRMLARVHQAFTSARDTTIELGLYQACENLYKNIQQACENMNQTIVSIEQLVLTFEREENSQNNLVKLDSTIKQAEITFQENFKEISDAMQKIEEHSTIFIKMVENVEDIVAREMWQRHLEKTKPQLAEVKEIEKNPQVKLIADPAALDHKFYNSPRQPKQSKKEVYINALRIWADDKENLSSQKIALANYLFENAGHHLLAKEKRYWPLCIFSIKTKSMATAQGLLAHGLSDQDKKQLLFNEKYMKRKLALEAYYEEMGVGVKKSIK